MTPIASLIRRRARTAAVRPARSSPGLSPDSHLSRSRRRSEPTRPAQTPSSPPRYQYRMENSRHSLRSGHVLHSAMAGAAWTRAVSALRLGGNHAAVSRPESAQLARSLNRSRASSASVRLRGVRATPATGMCLAIGSQPRWPAACVPSAMSTPSCQWPDSGSLLIQVMRAPEGITRPGGPGPDHGRASPAARDAAAAAVMENAVHITWSNLVGILSHVQAAPSGTSLTVSGRVDGSSAAVFEELLLRVSRTHRPPLLLDLSRIDSIDGAGLAALLTIRNLTAARDRRLRIIAASTPVRTLLCLTGAQHILEEAPRAV